MVEIGIFNFNVDKGTYFKRKFKSNKDFNLGSFNIFERALYSKIIGS